MVRPVVRPRLARGSRVAVVSPASAAKPDLVRQGMEHLQQAGYEPVLMPHASARGPLYYAGTAGERADDLHAAFADRSIAAILCTRGGWGSAELLPLLDRALVEANPKLFVGYSDHTSLHSWLWNTCRMASVYGPMVAADWSGTDGVDEASWLAASMGRTHRFAAADGLRTLRTGTATGPLLGGCLALIEAGLGTPWALRIDEPCILFLEDIGVNPYQWDRMLQHLRFAGVLEHVGGIVFGDMSANVAPPELPLLEEACLHALHGFAGPIALGLRCGHVVGSNRSLTLGTPATLACGPASASLTVFGSEGAQEAQP